MRACHTVAQALSLPRLDSSGRMVFMFRCVDVGRAVLPNATKFSHNQTLPEHTRNRSLTVAAR